MAAEIYRAFWDLVVNRPGLDGFGTNSTAHEPAGHYGARALDGDVLTTWRVATSIGTANPRLELTFAPEAGGGNLDIWIGLFNHNSAIAGVDTVALNAGPKGGTLSTLMRFIPLGGDRDQVHVWNSTAGSLGEMHIEFEHAAAFSQELRVGQVLVGFRQSNFESLPTEQIAGDVASVFPGTEDTARGVGIGRGGLGLREVFPIVGENQTKAFAAELLELWQTQRGVVPFAMHTDDHSTSNDVWDPSTIAGEVNITGRGGAYLVQPADPRMGFTRLHTGRRTVSLPIRRQIY